MKEPHPAERTEDRPVRGAMASGRWHRLVSALVTLSALLALLASSALAQAGTGSGGLHGRITDPSGAVIPGAEVTATTPDGQVVNSISDAGGEYRLPKLPAGTVSLRVSAPDFSEFTLPAVRISAGRIRRLDVSLRIAVRHEQLTVEGEPEETAVDVSPENNASATILKGEDLDALPDDPDELEQDLLALAGPAAGPNGGQIYIDGFSGGTLPPKSSIREIRVNQNPFSAAYDKPGYGRIEVFTKPGTDHWHGHAIFRENNSTFNSRNPYVQGPIPGYHSEIYLGDVSGPVGNKASIFLDAQQRSQKELGVVAATALPPDGEAVPSPRSRTNVSARMDAQLSPGNTLTARYQFLRNDQQNLGVGGRALASQAYTSNKTQHTVELRDTQVLSAHLINETRFQFVRTESTQRAAQTGAALDVLGVFQGGGNTIGQSADVSEHYELQNHTSWTRGRHYVRFGARMIVDRDRNAASSDFNGTFTFRNLDSYNAGAPEQYSVVMGSPRVALSYADVGAYAEDDWKLRPNLTLSYGLRFESQSGISDKADFAPRLGLSWGLGRGRHRPRTVLRFGYGIFYDRFEYAEQEQALRQNGVTQQEYVIANPSGYPNPPCDSMSSCEALSGSSPTIYQVNPHLRAPYTMQTAASIERQLGHIGRASLTYLYSRGLHQFLTRNVNAPCTATSYPDPSCLPGERPLAAIYGNGNVYQYNSEGIFKQHQLVATVQLRLSRRFSLLGYYALSFAHSDTGGIASFPSNQYNLKQDYGRAPFDMRHHLFLMGSASLAHHIRVSPFVIVHAGNPFNITTGRDNNGDSLFNDRPGIVAPGCAANDPVATQYGTLDRSPSPCEAILPINYGDGPANVTVNLRVSKTFGFGRDLSKASAEAEQQRRPERHHRGGGHHGSAGGGFARVGGGRGMFGPSSTSRRYNLTLSVTARNLFNTWNPGPPIGSLASPQLLGHSTSLASGPFSSGTASRRVIFRALISF